MKEVKYVVSGDKEVMFVSDKKRVPQYDHRWGTDKRIACIPAGFSCHRTFLADNWLSKKVGEFSKYNVRFIVCYNNPNAVTENTGSIKNLIKAIDGDFVILPVKANRIHNIPIREEAMDYAVWKMNDILRLAKIA